MISYVKTNHYIVRRKVVTRPGFGPFPIKKSIFKKCRKALKGTQITNNSQMYRILFKNQVIFFFYYRGFSPYRPVDRYERYAMVKAISID
jgi:hypothetical protein